MATVGESTAPSTHTIYYDALLTTTLMAYRKTLVDNIFKDSAFLAYLRMTDAVTNQNGGERIAIPLMYGDNSTIATHGGYSVIDTTPQDGLTTAFYEWAEIAGTISISRKETRQNAGEGKLIDLLKSKIQQAEMTMREKLNGDLLCGTPGTNDFVADTARDGSYGLLPLGHFCAKYNNTTRTGPSTVGNIAPQTHSWWRHRAFNLYDTTTSNVDMYVAASSLANFKMYLRRALNFTGRGSGGPADLLVMDQVSYETYENALDANMRYQNTRMADIGFDTIKLRGATCLWDEVTPDVYTGTAAITKGTVFFINTKFYKLVIDSETDVITTPFIEPENQTAKTAKILFMGNATCSNLRKMGVAWGISQTITT